MIHFLEIESLVSLALLKLHRTHISTRDLSMFTSSINKKAEKLDYMFLYGGNYLDHLKEVYSEYFEIRDNIIFSKVDLDKLIEKFVVYLPNNLLTKAFEE